MGCALPPMAESSSSEVLALDRGVASGLEWGWMNRGAVAEPPGERCELAADIAG